MGMRQSNSVCRHRRPHSPIGPAAAAAAAACDTSLQLLALHVNRALHVFNCCCCCCCVSLCGRPLHFTRRCYSLSAAAAAASPPKAQAPHSPCCRHCCSCCCCCCCRSCRCRCCRCCCRCCCCYHLPAGMLPALTALTGPQHTRRCRKAQ